MPPFKPPPPSPEKDKAWSNAAKRGFRNPRKVWGEYWQRFNTITIPLMDPDAYFADAIDAASQANDREHLEELLAEKCDDRRRELERLLRFIALDSIFSKRRSLMETARDAGLKAGQTGSLDSFLQVLCGVIHGWEGEEDVEESRRVTDGKKAEKTSDDYGFTGDVGAGSVRGHDEDAGDDYADDAGYDPDEFGNGPQFPGEWNNWAERDDDAYNSQRPRVRVGECVDADEAPIERQPLPADPPPAGENMPSTTERARAEEADLPAVSPSPPTHGGTSSGSGLSEVLAATHTPTSQTSLPPQSPPPELSGSPPTLYRSTGKRSHSECVVDERGDSGGQRRRKRVITGADISASSLAG